MASVSIVDITQLFLEFEHRNMTAFSQINRSLDRKHHALHKLVFAVIGQLKLFIQILKWLEYILIPEDIHPQLEVELIEVSFPEFELFEQMLLTVFCNE